LPAALFASCLSQILQGALVTDACAPSLSEQDDLSIFDPHICRGCTDEAAQARTRQALLPRYREVTPSDGRQLFRCGSEIHQNWSVVNGRLMKGHDR
jgi:hypothetical protein